MYFDQLLLAARKVHVVYFNQLLGAAHYIHFISNHDKIIILGRDQLSDNNSCSTTDETEQTSTSRKFQRNRTSFISDQVQLLENGEYSDHSIPGHIGPGIKR